MELGLSLGDPPNPFGFLEKHNRGNDNKGSAFCMDLSIGPCGTGEDGGGGGERVWREEEEPEEPERKEQQGSGGNDVVCIAQIENIVANDKPGTSPVQLDLLPLSPVPRTTSSHGFPWSSSTECGGVGGLELNRVSKATAEEAAEEGSSPNSNSGATSFQMEMCLYNNNSNYTKGLDRNNNNNNNIGNSKRDHHYVSEGEEAKASSSQTT
ncbi:hypothetical protein TIFTF001_024460 [Ficus carica]|uniref:Uncharacterized protein n=1 Tax=Ficus carica TaxID=3494 RepID=A0AA88B0Q4_FICCA|nr:hypothetical protein TIFTF001_024460 [Ficus carica]